MKSKMIVLTAHCIINQNSVIEGWARARGAFPIVELLTKEGIGIIQLPCPELIFYGINRPPLEYEDYNKADYRELCQSLLFPYIKQIKDYLANGYTLLGIISVHKSPTCSISDRRGVLMEELFSACEKENICLKYVEIPETYNENESNNELEQQIKSLWRLQSE